MVLTIRKRIWGSFLILVLVFVTNGVITIITLNNSKQLSNHIEMVIDPAQQSLQDFKDILIKSKMYTTNWVFLRSDQEDKDALHKLHSQDYPLLRQRIYAILPKLDNQKISDSLRVVFKGFDELEDIERGIMSSLREFEDYDDPVKKMLAEQTVEDQVIPITTRLLNALNRVASDAHEIKIAHYNNLERHSVWLRTLISMLAISIIGIGVLLSAYFTKVITKPIEKIKQIINDLGKGIINKVDYKENSDEIGLMVRSVNNLSDKLLETATFAQEVGNRNFNLPYTPLSEEDILGKALLAMRTNLKTSEENLLKTSSSLIRRHKALEQYTYIISHNLRAPVATIRGLTELLEQENLAPEDRDIILKGLAKSVRNLDKIIHDLNQILQMKNDLHEMTEEVSFRQLVNETKLIFKTFIDEGSVVFRCDFTEAESIFSLKSYLSSIFYNLISNSIKYRRPEERLIIEIESRKTDNTVILTFRDNGKGIDLQRNGEDLFGLYKRFDFSVEGKGMGLFMIKNQVENLNGTISVSSKVNEGTEFTIELPVNAF